MMPAEDDELPNLTAERPMTWWERTASGVAGVLVLVTGCLATFWTTNQAGAAVLVIVGAGLTIVGLQGTRLLQIGGSAASIQLARLQGQVQGKKQAAEQVLQLSETKGLEEAEALREAAVEIDPHARRIIDGAAMYEDALHEALKRIWSPGVDLERNAGGAMGRAVDFGVTSDNGPHVVIEAKYRRPGTRFSNSDLEAAAAQARMIMGDVPILIVTNADRVTRVRPPASVELVKWTSRHDDASLRDALRRLGVPIK